MPPRCKEKDLVRAIKQYLSLEGFEVFRLNNAGIFNPKSGGYFFHGVKGLPDLMAVKKNYPILFIEVKTPKGRVSADQKRVLNLIKKSWGGRAIVARSIPDVQKFLARLKPIFNV